MVINLIYPHAPLKCQSSHLTFLLTPILCLDKTSNCSRFCNELFQDASQCQGGESDKVIHGDTYVLRGKKNHQSLLDLFKNC